MFSPFNSEHSHAILRVSSSSFEENIQKWDKETNFRDATTERNKKCKYLPSLNRGENL
jgi:hypothetical protein